MKPVPHGEPYAGKLHVRFDEGAGVPDNKGRSALLYTLLSPVHQLPRPSRRFLHHPRREGDCEAVGNGAMSAALRSMSQSGFIPERGSRQS